MEDDKKTVEHLDQLFAAGDAWLRKFGLVTAIAHNSIVANLYVNFPKIRYLEYFLPRDSTTRKVWVVLYVPLHRLIFTSRDNLIDEVIQFLREYLDGYDIQVQLKRYKKGIERSNEVPNTAIDHINADRMHERESVSDSTVSSGATSGAAGEDTVSDKVPESKP